MTKQDRQKLSILIVLIVVLGVTIFIGYRTNQTPAAAGQRLEQKTPANLPSTTDARIRLDLLENSADGEIGSRNLFQYRQNTASSAANGGPSRGGLHPGDFNASLPPAIVSTPAVPSGPPQPPPPPPVPLKYQGFAANVPNGGMIAFLADDSRHYNVTAGEILMGRFRVVSITDKSVDIEDLQHSRHQTLPLLK
jgi:hypothetical protein